MAISHSARYLCGFILDNRCCIFYPYLQGKVLQQSDTTMWEASSKESLDYRKETGESALWNTRMFGGMPTYQITSPAKSNYLVYVQSALALFTSGPLYYFILFSICSYIFYLALSMLMDSICRSYKLCLCHE
ncbi:MAG: hypothetical protein IPK61_02445 [Saprospiraceae bacterium]|nr:hypothetical protein [Saprospiraceae bacterium]